MKLEPFRQKYIREIISWIKTEQDMIQWAGSVFSWPLAQRQIREHLKAAGQELPTLYPFALHNRGKIVGYCEISDLKRRYNSAMLSRVLISPRRRGRGLGEFMINEALRIGFNQLGLNRIGLGVFDFNVPAIRCYVKAGFIYEGTMRQSAKAGDEYWNCHIMSVLQTEWKE
jgi:RimJ/RimL family protein N-acetyltransferase